MGSTYLSNRVDSIQQCAILANGKGYKFFGLQYGSECWASNNLTNSEKYGVCGQSTRCKKPTCNCAAMKCKNGVDDCGDNWASALYAISPFKPSQKPSTKPSSKPFKSPVVKHQDIGNTGGSDVSQSITELTIGAYIGIASGIFVLIGFIICCCYYWYMKKYQSKPEVTYLDEVNNISPA